MEARVALAPWVRVKLWDNKTKIGCILEADLWKDQPQLLPKIKKLENYRRKLRWNRRIRRDYLGRLRI